METKRAWGVIIWNGIGMPPKDNIRFTEDKDVLIEYLENNCKDGDKLWFNHGIVIGNDEGWKQNGMTAWATDYKVILDRLIN